MGRAVGSCCRLGVRGPGASRDRQSTKGTPTHPLQQRAGHERFSRFVAHRAPPAAERGVRRQNDLSLQKVHLRSHSEDWRH